MIMLWSVVIFLLVIPEIRTDVAQMVFIKQKQSFVQYPEKRFKVSRIECAQKCIGIDDCVAFDYAEKKKCTISYNSSTAPNAKSDTYVIRRNATACNATQITVVEDSLHQKYATLTKPCDANTMIMQKLPTTIVGKRSTNTPYQNPQPDCLQYCLLEPNCTAVEINGTNCFLVTPDASIGESSFGTIYMKMDACAEIPTTNSRMSAEAKSNILDLHNRERSAVAMGSFKAKATKLPKAAAMRKLVWNYTLESKAQYVAERCAHQPERVGENSLYDPGNKWLMDQGRKIVEKWLVELKTRGWQENRYTSNTDVNIRNALQSIWGESHQVGCGMHSSGDNQMMFACHYWPPGKVLQEVVYAEGNTTCENCPNGTTCSEQLGEQGLCR